MLPRLPNEPPSPARASASPGDKASAKAAEPAIRAEVRRIWFRFNVVTRPIWCVRSVMARGGQARQSPAGYQLEATVPIRPKRARQNQHDSSAMAMTLVLKRAAML